MLTHPNATSPRPDETEALRLRLRRARWAAAAPFLVLGLAFSSLFVRIPELKQSLGLSEGQLGLFLTLPLLTGLFAMQMTGRLVARFGSGPVLRVTMVVLPLVLSAFGPAGELWLFALVLLVFGVVDGFIDISMNAHAVAVERALGRHIMNSCHAAWSIGAAAGSALGGLAIAAGLSITWHFLLLALVLVPGGLAAGRHLLDASADRAAPRPAAERKGAAWRTGWTPRLLVLGATGTVVLLTGGVVGNWGGIFLHDELGASLATASLGVIAFSVCEAGVRLVGDRLHERYGATRLVRVSGTIAVAGLAIVVLSPHIAMVIAGFGLLGLGLSVLMPVIFSAVGHGGADAAGAADALAKVGTMTYSGLLLGPVVVGWCAEAVGLTATLAGLLALLTATLAAGLRRI